VAVPPSENVAGPHARQPAADAVPGLVTAPANPGAQVVQAETDVLPVAKPVVVIPAGQLEQLVEPDEDAYDAAAHGAHDDEPGDDEKDPGPHCAQLPLPGDDEEPAGQIDVQLALGRPGSATVPA
jgi:hypothetical protein